MNKETEGGRCNKCGKEYILFSDNFPYCSCGGTIIDLPYDKERYERNKKICLEGTGHFVETMIL
jgi:endogenous inhibitor of DNA gyrase (YacG/DUF329 family)